MAQQHHHSNQKGRRLALFIAGVGVFWIIVTALGTYYGWSMRTLALFDLLALAGFGVGIWSAVQMWRDRRD